MLTSQTHDFEEMKRQAREREAAAARPPKDVDDMQEATTSLLSALGIGGDAAASSGGNRASEARPGGVGHGGLEDAAIVSAQRAQDADKQAAAARAKA